MNLSIEYNIIIAYVVGLFFIIHTWMVIGCTEKISYKAYFKWSSRSIGSIFYKYGWKDIWNICRHKPDNSFSCRLFRHTWSDFAYCAAVYRVK